MEDVLLHVCSLGHNGEVRLGGWSEDHVGLGFNFFHLWVVLELVLRHEVLVKLEVHNPRVLSDGLEANSTEVLEGDCTLLINLRGTPSAQKRELEHLTNEIQIW